MDDKPTYGKITLIWEIENINMFDLSKEIDIRSSVFKLETPLETEWFMGIFAIDEKDVDIYIKRDDDSNRPVTLSFNVYAFCDKEEPILLLGGMHTKFDLRTKSSLVNVSSLVENENKCFPKKTLTIKCELFGESVKRLKSVVYSAKTELVTSTHKMVWKTYDCEYHSVSPTLHMPDGTSLNLVLSHRSVYSYFTFNEESPPGDQVQCRINLLRAGGGRYPLVTRLMLFTKMNVLNVFWTEKEVRTAHLESADGIECEFTHADGSYVSHEPEKKTRSARKDILVHKSIQKCPLETEQIFSLPPQQFPDNSLNTRLKNLYSGQTLCDFALRSKEGDVLNVHSLVMAARSPLFLGMVMESRAEKNPRFVERSDFEADVLKKMVHFAYTDRVEEMPLDRVLKLYAASRRYEMEELRSSCRAMIISKIKVSNLCDVLLFSTEQSDQELFNATCDFSHLNKSVFVSDEWRTFRKEHFYLATRLREAIVRR